MTDGKPFNRLKQCRHGLMLYNINDMYVGRSFDLYGEFSHGETEVFDQFIKPGDSVLDVGANIGAHTLYFAKKVGPGGLVLAFEPQRIVFQVLCANMALNSLTNVHCFQVGVAEKPGKMQAAPLSYESTNNFGGMALGSYPQGESVDVLRLDAFVLGACKLIKIDVEGMELQALQGASGIIERHKPILYVENDRKDKAEALVRYIDSIGYAIYWHNPPLYNPENFLKNPNNVFANIVSKNLLCFHKSVSVKVEGITRVEIPA